MVAEEAGSIEVRLNALLETVSGNIERWSDAIALTITPYDVSLPPSLFVVGAGAADAGWSWDSPVQLNLIELFILGTSVFKIMVEQITISDSLLMQHLQWDSPSQTTHTMRIEVMILMSA